MVPPLLKLAFVQGPRDGDTLQYKPGSTIRIGRIVRGNDIAIKDAGISTKHLRIVSDSDNWLIQDLGSSNGTTLNSDALDPVTPVNLRHGDVIKLGEFTSIVVNFVIDVQPQAEEKKLPPKPRRNNRRLAVTDPDPDPNPVESVQEKPTRKGRSSKQQEEKLEQPKRTRATRSRALEDIVNNEKEVDVVANEKQVKPRVGRSRKNEKKVEITKEEEEEVPMARRSKNTASIENLSLHSIKLEVEDTPMAAEIPAMKRGTRSKKIVNVKSEDNALEEGTSRATTNTRSKKQEIGGDSFMELDMVLNQARKSRAKKKKMEQIPSKSVEIEPSNDVVEEDKDREAQECCSERSDKEDETSKMVDQDKDLNCTVREDEETENLQDTIDEERDGKSYEGGVERSDGGCDEEKVEQVSESNKNVVENEVELDLEKMTLGGWFSFMEVDLRKQIVEETEKMIEPMRSKAQRVHKYIAEQKKARGKS